MKPTPSDAALKALGQIATDERTRPGRKLLLWIGPGWGIGSGAYADAVQGSPPPFDAVWWFSTLLREAHLVLYSFTVGETDPRAQLYKAYLDGVKIPRKASFMNLYRKVLAVQSGGRVLDGNGGSAASNRELRSRRRPLLSHLLRPAPSRPSQRVSRSESRS